MLRSIKDLDGYKVTATDGDLGTVNDFLVEDTSWVVRYLVAKTGALMVGRRVLITPTAFHAVDYSGNRFKLSLSMMKIKNSPSVNTDLPVSRQNERDYYSYYGYPYYWGYGALGGDGRDHGFDGGAPEPASTGRAGEPASDVHLRSAKEITGYHVEGTDGPIGHVKDLVVDDETWEIKYLVLATTNWWPGESVLISPMWTTRISWADRKVYVGMTRDAIKTSPKWTATYPVESSYAEELYRHYAGTRGWVARDRNVLAASSPPQGAADARSGQRVDATVVERANARAAAHEEGQVRAADRAVVEDARAGRMP
jgi:sporulation protein YlmC with PRC-barrel domain